LASSRYARCHTVDRFHEAHAWILYRLSSSISPHALLGNSICFVYKASWYSELVWIILDYHQVAWIIAYFEI
jgi:hypothetical protein